MLAENILIFYSILFVGIFPYLIYKMSNHYKCIISAQINLWDIIYRTSNLYPNYNIFEHNLKVDISKAQYVNIISDVGITNECCGKENIVHLTGTEELENLFVFRCNKCGNLFIATWG